MDVMITMAVAVLIVHANDPWGKQEFGLLYFFAFLSLAIAGAGRFSVDAKLAQGLRAGGGAG